MNVGRKIREAREDLGMQQTVLARRVGVWPNTIARYESGDRVPPVVMLEKIAEELRTEPAEFLREPGAGEAADLRLRRLRETLWLQLRGLDAAGAVRTEAPRGLGEVLGVLEELDNVEKRMMELAPTPLATIVMRLDEPTWAIYHRDPTDEERAGLRAEYPDAIEVEAKQVALAY